MTRGTRYGVFVGRADLLRKETRVKTAKDVLALLGLLFVGYVALAMCEALGLVHLTMGGH